MVRLTTPLALASVALAACSPVPADGTPDISQSPATAPADEAAVRAAALALYAGNGGPQGSSGLSGDLRELTPEFGAAWNRAVGGPEYGLDFDPFCDCQDPLGLSGAKVAWVAFKGDTATVELMLQWDSGPQPKQLVFKRAGGKWLLDDLTSGEWQSLHRAMAEAEPGSWGIG